MSLRPDTAAVPVDNATANRQTDSCAGIFALAVEPLEGAKDLFGVLRVKANTTVLDRYAPFAVLFPGCNLNAGFPARLAEFDGIGDQVLEKQPPLPRSERGQQFWRARPFAGRLQQRIARLANHVTQPGPRQHRRLGADLRTPKIRINCIRGAIDRESNVLPPRRRACPGSSFQQLR
jgi:hypothetical protein